MDYLHKQILFIFVQQYTDAYFLMTLFNQQYIFISFNTATLQINIFIANIRNLYRITMNPESFNLPLYENIPLLSNHDYQRLTHSKKTVLFKNLIVDISDFDHPGYNNILTPFVGKDTYESYISKTHSYNADLIICHRTIGRLEDSPYDSDSKIFYNSAKNHQKVKQHQEILQKYDPSLPLLEWIKKLKTDELTVLTQIPKLFKKPYQITFVKDRFINFVFKEEHFWISFAVFILDLLLILYWILSQHSVLQFISGLHLSVIGCVAWTLVEYIFHRFQLHPTGKLPEGDLRPHLLHHSFPNLKNKVALSWVGINVHLAIILVCLRMLLADFTVGMLLLGFVGTLTAYDCIHYYCHFGPEMEWSWLKSLRINHLKHHYRNQQTNFGVTTNLWDKVFGTFDRTQKVQ